MDGGVGHDCPHERVGARLVRDDEELAGGEMGRDGGQREAMSAVICLYLSKERYRSWGQLSWTDAASDEMILGKES